MYNRQKAEASKKLIKIDRNGSKHYEMLVPCGKCGGSGIIPWSRIDNQVCWQCLGGGSKWAKVIERTPEYEAKLEARRQKKHDAQMKKAQEEFDAVYAESLSQWGFTEAGQTFLFLGNTFEQKDAIKETGAKFNQVLGWHIDHPVEGFEFLEIHFDKDDFMTTYTGKIFDIDTSKKYSREHVDFLKKQEFERLHPVEHTSEYQGQVKERLKGLELTVTFETTYETHFSFYGETRYLYVMEDKDGNIFTWTASSMAGTSKGEWIPVHKGNKVILDGTVKEHKEYKGDKQTVLTRCTVKGVA